MPRHSATCARFAALALLTLGAALPSAQAQGNPAQTTLIPRQKVTLRCADTYFKTVRENFLLQDETYAHCTLSLPLTLRQRWPDATTFYVIPRVSASLATRGDKREAAQWHPLAPLVNPGPDPLHLAVPASSYTAVTLTGTFGTLTDQAGNQAPDTVSTGGKLTVCAAPVAAGQSPCHTFDVAARFKVYRR